MRLLSTIALLTLGCGVQRVELFDRCDACEPDRDAGVTPVGLRDPENCGVEDTHCEDDEYCVDGRCVCREGMVRDGDDCIDPNVDADRCGEAQVACSDACEAGECVASCSVGTDCDDDCVDLMTHPLHCGECGRPCGANQVCVRGECTAFQPIVECSECARSCCTYPNRPSDLICVDGDACE